MKITVAIPAYNAASIIRSTLESVLRQTLLPDEILVIDDGSTDGTAEVARSFGSRVTVLQEGRKGVCGARNTLCERAQGDLLAFLDSDDIWHPKYLETQCSLFDRHPEAAVGFTGHVNFNGPAGYDWDRNPIEGLSGIEVFDPTSFFREYNRSTGRFGSMSYCCIAKHVLHKVSEEPFGSDVSPTEDSYFLYRVALSGGRVVYAPAQLAAYRISAGSISSNRLRGYGSWVRVFEQLEDRFRREADRELYRVFALAFASKRRSFAKILMGAGKVSEARSQMRRALVAANPVSNAKSSLLLFSTYLPSSLQPNWAPSSRQTSQAA